MIQEWPENARRRDSDSAAAAGLMLVLALLSRRVASVCLGVQEADVDHARTCGMPEPTRNKEPIRAELPHRTAGPLSACALAPRVSAGRLDAPDRERGDPPAQSSCGVSRWSCTKCPG